MTHPLRNKITTMENILNIEYWTRHTVVTNFMELRAEHGLDDQRFCKNIGKTLGVLVHITVDNELAINGIWKHNIIERAIRQIIQ